MYFDSRKTATATAPSMASAANFGKFILWARRHEHDCHKNRSKEAVPKESPFIVAHAIRPHLFIFHAHEKKPAGGGRGCGGGAVTQFKNASDILDGKAAFTDHKKCSHEIAHHVVEKSVAAHGVDQFVGVALQLGEIDVADIIDFKSRFVRPRFVRLMLRAVCFKSGVVGFKAGICREGLLIGCKSFFAFFRIDSGEAGEVMLAFYDGGGLDHAGFRERVRMVVNIARLEWRANCSSIDVVAVSFGDS